MPDRAPVTWAEPEGQDLIRRLLVRSDPEADAVVAAFDEEVLGGGGGEVAGRVIGELTAERVDAHPLIRGFLEVRDWPDWVDDELLDRGQQLFRDHHWSFNVAFLLGSLPMSYGGAAGAEVLTRTGGFDGAPRRRVFETALLISELAERDQLRPGGHAYVTLRRLRLLHAAVRRTIAVHGYDDDHPGRPVPWDADADGVAVNQLDLLGTLWAFALTSFTAMEKAQPGIAGGREAWVHLWSLTGYLLGLTPDADLPPVLPMRWAEAEECFLAIQDERFAASDAGRELATALVDMARGLLPGKRFDPLVEALVRDNIGRVHAERLGIGPGASEEALRRARWLWGLSEEAPSRSWVDRVGRWRVRSRVMRTIVAGLARPDYDESSLRDRDARRLLLDTQLESMGRWARRRHRWTARRPGG